MRPLKDMQYTWLKIVGMSEIISLSTSIIYGVELSVRSIVFDCAKQCYVVECDKSGKMEYLFINPDAVIIAATDQ